MNSPPHKTNKKDKLPPGFETLPQGIVREADGTVYEMSLLLKHLPKPLVDYLQERYSDHNLMTLNEIYMQLGQRPELIFADETGKTQRETLDMKCTQDHIIMFAE